MALRKGDRAPNFILKNAEGEEVSLYENLLNGPVILTWYPRRMVSLLQHDLELFEQGNA